MIPSYRSLPRAIPCNLKRSAVEEVAQALAKKVGYTPGDSLEDVVEKLGGTINYVRSLSEAEESGAIVVEGPREFVIHIPSFTGPLRDRFTIAHELGHYALHSKFGRGKLGVARGGSDQAEWEANWFAAAFLMPKELFQRCVAEGKDDGQIAQAFQVSRAAAEIRRKSLNP